MPKIEYSKVDKPLFGQWIGKFDRVASTLPGNPMFVHPGIATFNIEYDRPTIGFACIDQGNQIHGSRKNFTLKIEGNRFTGRSTATTAFDWQKSEIISLEESVRRQNGSVFYLADLVLHDGFINEETVTCKWSGSHSGNEFTGKFEGRKLRQNEQSAPDYTKSWEDFKRFVADTIQSDRDLLFRSQPSNKHRLNTSFHREGRYDLLRYDQEDCVELEQQINATSTRQYDRNNSSDYGPLLSLAQHHGFPTPLLDWSKSPYIAAFFALENRQACSVDGDNPRIYVFDAMAWQRETTQAHHIADPRPVITPREFPAHNNPRHLPQQSVHTYTNIEDIEGWIRLVEQQKKKRYLSIIDIPRSERKIAMRDLAYMGVNAAALFPGLDGICRSLKARFF